MSLKFYIHIESLAGLYKFSLSRKLRKIINVEDHIN